MTTDAQVPQTIGGLEVRSTASRVRADAQIAREAENALARIALVPQDSVRVSVDDAWVRLTGQVDTWYQRWGAGTAVYDIAGIRGVTNEIKVLPEVLGAGVWAEIENALAHSPRLEA